MSSDLITTFSQQDLQTVEYAQNRDASDPLASYRDKFFMPVYNSAEYIAKYPESQGAVNETDKMFYFCGNSLGLQPKQTGSVIKEELDKWMLSGVEGHFTGTRPWATVEEKALEYLVPLVGAVDTSEVAIMNSLSANLHLLMISFYVPKGERRKIIMESGAFCSDNHIIRSQLALHNCSLDSDLILLAPREGESVLRTEDIIAKIEQVGDHLALVILPGIQFYTGQFFEIAPITAAGQKVGAKVGWDLAHAVGNVPLQLHNWNVDFAVWCHYKYCNSGPGAVGGAFVHKQYHTIPSKTEYIDPLDQEDGARIAKLAEYDGERFTRLEGWWGQQFQNRFRMGTDHVPALGAGAWALSNPPVFGLIPVEAGLQIHYTAGMDALRTKSVQLTAYLEALLHAHVLDKPNKNNISVRIITPTDHSQRGAQLSLEFDSNNATEIYEALRERGAILDKRRPSVIRISPAPLYNTYLDVFHVVQLLKAVLNSNITKQ